MVLLLMETHEFESRYVEPLSLPPGLTKQEPDTILRERSPVTCIEYSQSDPHSWWGG